MSVSITTDGNIFFDIALPDVITIDFRLLIEYMPLNNPTLTIPRTTNEGFSNTNNVLYLERAPPSDILNTGFKLRVALTTPNLETGPRSNMSSILGIDVCECVCVCVCVWIFAYKILTCNSFMVPISMRDYI